MRLPIARYRFNLRFEDVCPLPPYLGGMLRGAFGHALRRVACTTGASECEGCPVAARCAYARLFEPRLLGQVELEGMRGAQDRAAPYAIEPPAWHPEVAEADDVVDFCMVLVGEAIAQLPLIILAWQRAAQWGFGKSGGRAELVSVAYLDPLAPPNVVWSATQPFVTAHEPGLAYPFMAPRSAVMELTTPLRLQQMGKVLGADDIDAHALISALSRRMRWIDSLYLGGVLPSVSHESLQAMIDDLDGELQLGWQDVHRYSTRQQQRTPLGGVLGIIQLENIAPEIGTWLVLGQWLHFGKETVFGLGGYHLQSVLD